MKASCLSLLALFAVLLLASARAAPAASSAWETLYLDSLSNASVRAFAENYTATAHLAGTQEDYQSALYTQAQALPLPPPFPIFPSPASILVLFLFLNFVWAGHQFKL
jgi:hypothetical protein